MVQEATYHSTTTLGRLYATEHTTALNVSAGHEVLEGKLKNTSPQATEHSRALMQALSRHYNGVGNRRLSIFFRRYGGEVIGTQGAFHSLNLDDVLIGKTVKRVKGYLTEEDIKLAQSE